MEIPVPDETLVISARTIRQFLADSGLGASASR
jgi:hypothetical protein